MVSRFTVATLDHQTSGIKHIGVPNFYSTCISSSGVVVILEIFFFGLGLTVAEIKKVQEQDFLKTLKM